MPLEPKLSSSAPRPAPNGNGHGPKKKIIFLWEKLTELSQSGNKRKFLLIAGTIVFVLVSLVSLISYWVISNDLPPMISLADYRPAGVTTIVGTTRASEGVPPENVVIGEYFKERRYLIPIEEIPEVAQRAFVSAEDDGFFEHTGISPMAILRASLANFRAGHVVQGGSTITQQVAKSLFLTPERNLIRKVKEAILAGRIEKNLRKDQILYLYLNQIYLGHGSYGVEAAARTYFNKKAVELTVPEAAILAGLPQAPSRYSPWINTTSAKDRQRYVLRRMKENGFLTEEEMTTALTTPVKLYRIQNVTKTRAPYYSETVRQYLIDHFGEKNLFEEGMTVYVPARVDLAAAAQKSLRAGLHEVDKWSGYRGPIRHFNTEEEIRAHLEGLKKRLIQERVPYSMIMPDGTLDDTRAMEDFGFKSAGLLIELDSIHEAVVVAVDDRKKETLVDTGAGQFVIPFALMEWAKVPRANIDEPSPAIRVPSEVLHTGDVVWVKITKPEVKKGSRASQEWVAALEQRPEVQGAILSLDAQTGAVLAMEGGFEYKESEFNRALQARRQPGSAFKPIVFSAAIEKGITPSTIIVDSPVVYDDEEAGKWKPSNYGDKFHGDVTVREIFSRSLNIPTIKIVEKIGIPTVIDFARKVGITGTIHDDFSSSSLGSGSTTLLELVSVYSLFPRLGQKLEPVFINKIVDRDGVVLEERQPTPRYDAAEVVLKSLEKKRAELQKLAGKEPLPENELIFPSFPNEEFPNQLMDPRVAGVMIGLMKDVVRYGTGAQAQELGRPVAGKTGTTNDSKDTWFIGFTPQIVSGSWVGYDDQQRTMGSRGTGGRAALPIWLDFMKDAHQGVSVAEFSNPPGIVKITIDAQTGKKVSATHPQAREAVFLQGTEPRETIRTTGQHFDNQTEFLKEEFE